MSCCKMSVINSCICLLVISQTQTHHHSPLNTSGPPVTLYHCTSDSSSLKTLHHQSALVISILNRPVDGPSVNQWSMNERLSDKAFDSPTVVHTMTWPNGLRHLQQNSWQHPLYVQLSTHYTTTHIKSSYHWQHQQRLLYKCPTVSVWIVQFSSPQYMQW